MISENAIYAIIAAISGSLFGLLIIICCTIFIIRRIFAVRNISLSKVIRDNLCYDPINKQFIEGESHSATSATYYTRM